MPGAKSLVFSRPPPAVVRRPQLKSAPITWRRTLVSTNFNVSLLQTVRWAILRRPVSFISRGSGERCSESVNVAEDELVLILPSQYSLAVPVTALSVQPLVSPECDIGSSNLLPCMAQKVNKNWGHMWRLSASCPAIAWGSALFFLVDAFG